MRSPAAGPARNDPDLNLPAYFKSLDDLVQHAAAPNRRNRRAAPIIPYTPPGSPLLPRGKLLVCHDYKGGYCERDDERGYTFNWWHLTDTFIYFSHHRVSPPPPAWIRTAHRHGTKILGTLIFEPNHGFEDLIKLTRPTARGANAGVDFDHVGLGLADLLVDLCVERGFEGWLINVEVPFARDETEKHIKAMLTWLRYLRSETRRRVGPGAEIMWYDGANFEGVRWQNELNELNRPFLDACDSIFLNYFWRERHIEQTTDFVERSTTIRRDQVYFGLDVFGRGQVGGAGFSSWIALDMVERITEAMLKQPLALPASSDTSAIESGSSLGTINLIVPQAPICFPIALFAPGWTVESEHLGHALTTRDGYERWFADESYLWAGTAPTPSVSLELTRMEKVRKEERGVHYARLLAQAFGVGKALERFDRFDYNAPLPPLPGVFRPIKSYHPTPRPPPAPQGSFYTNFSRGSGHEFFVQGREVSRSATGWTDVDFAFPFPSLALPSRIEGVETRLVENDAWLGPCGLRIEMSRSSVSEIPLAATNVPLLEGSPLKVDIVWKKSFSCQVKLQVKARSSDYSLTLRDIEERAHSNGWTTTSALIACDWPRTVTSCGISLASVETHSVVLIGAISIYPVSSLPSACVAAGLEWSPDGEWLSWDLVHKVYPEVTASLSIPEPSTMAQSMERPTSFLLWHISDSDSHSEPTFLGATSALEFAISRARLGTGMIVLDSVRHDGSIDDLNESRCNV